ncbi:MAG TPA: hypothetical protein VFE50_12615 [Cyclobacteriaceae bacterium]|nr:hypothetical protein [Cyclobacteriaceae bacterium]
MRRPLLRTGFTLLIVSALALSCREEQSTEVAKAQSPFRQNIEAYLDQLNPETENELRRLSELRHGLDFSDIDRQPLSDNEDVLIAGTHSLDLEKGSVVKALFFVQHGQVVRSNIVAFTNTQADHNKLVISIIRRRFDPNSYSGRISFYSIFGDIIFFNEIDQGQFTANGVAQSRRSSKAHSASRSQGCIDWYLVTTYHYAGGGTSTSEQYLTTTCGGECQTVRMQGRTQCGGGGSAASAGPALPGFAADGDRYIFTDPDGKTTTYLYDHATRAWTIYSVVLPEMVVQSHPATYSYLASDGPPADNSWLKGPDNLLYIYDAWSGAWEAGQDFYVGGDGRDVIGNKGDFFRCFRTARPANLTIYVDQPKAGSNIPVSGTDVGHAWVGLSQTYNGVTVTRVFGFYPEGKSTPLFPEDPGVVVNDSRHEYDVSVTFEVSASQLIQIINFATNKTGEYDLNTNNCVNFVVDACRSAGIKVPANESDWLGGGGLSPGQFGEDMRKYNAPGKLTKRDTDGGTAPAQSGDCQL